MEQASLILGVLGLLCIIGSVFNDSFLMVSVFFGLFGTALGIRGLIRGQSTGFILSIVSLAIPIIMLFLLALGGYY